MWVKKKFCGCAWNFSQESQFIEEIVENIQKILSEESATASSRPQIDEKCPSGLHQSSCKVTPHLVDYYCQSGFPFFIASTNIIGDIKKLYYYF